MNETMRTTIYVVAAIFSLIVARSTGPSVPKSPKEFSQVGVQFYPDFTDASTAKSLQVVSYNSDTATVRVFGVEQGADGVWRIPSRNNYPVDGKDRLAKSATSVIGIKRDSLAGQRKTQHAEFGVLDPLGENVSDFKGVGNRLTLKDGKDGKTLVDLIIGKEVKGRSGFFYVRNPKEDQTYTAKVSLDVSTKFADWIEPDLLKLDSSKLRSIIVDKHSIEITPEGGKIGGKETNKLTKGGAPGDKWKLEDLDEATEEVNEDEVRKLVQALDDLKIVGVRPKSDKLKKRLQDDKGINPTDDRTRIEMQDMGFFFAPTANRRYMMISQEGDLFASTEQGVVYDLHFGAAFTGSEEEVEAGFINKPDAEKKDDAKNDQQSNSKKINSRYLFAQAQFDAEALGPKPVAPEKPEPPTDEAKPEAEKTDPAAAADPKATENKSETETKTDKVDPKKAYEAALAAYESDMKKFEADAKAYDEKVKAGEKQVKDLNRRFAEWYYVISGDSFESLRQGRKTLVKAKPAATKPADQKPEDQKQPETDGAAK